MTHSAANMPSGPGRIGQVAIGDIIRRSARKYPDKIAVVDEDVRLSYSELDARCNRFAQYLLAKGLGPGDRVATLCQNSHQLLAAIFGMHKAGLVWVPVNPALPPEDVSYILGHAEAKAVLVDAALLVHHPDLRETVGGKASRLIVIPAAGMADGGPGATPFEGALLDQPADDPEVEIPDRHLAQIMYTSGTTGRPKGVMQCHIAVCLAALGNIIEMELRSSDVGTAMMPLFHCAQHTLAASLLHVGGTVVLLRGFDAGRLLATIERERVTFVFALPVMFGAILDHPERAQHDLSGLRLCLYAMAPMSEPMLRRLIGELCSNFALASGQTEMYPATVIFRPEEQLRRFGSYWGVSSLINETAIMDEAGNLLPPGEVGEIVHRGANVMMGYYKNPEATTESRRFGWHHTGDLGLFDGDGQLLFTDRKKDMVKTGGENVASIKVEAVLLRHPAVANAAVVGLPHPRWSEAVTGFVLLKAGTSATETEIIEHCREHLAGFEAPKAIRIVEKLPLTATGKIQKNVLRDAYRDLYAPFKSA